MNPNKPEDEWVRDKSPEIVRGMFTSISSTYDTLNHLFSLNIDKRWRKFAANQTITGPHVQAILDVCGGTGDLAMALQKEASRQKFYPLIICSDFTPSMTNIAQSKFNKHYPASHSKLKTMVADTTSLPFDDNSFDVVTVGFGIRNVVDTRKGLAEMVRVCRPGGTVAVLEFSKTRSPLINGAFRFYFRHILPFTGRLITGTRAYSYLSKSVEVFPEGTEFCNLLSSVTRTSTIATPLSFGIATLYISKKA